MHGLHTLKPILFSKHENQSAFMSPVFPLWFLVEGVLRWAVQEIEIRRRAGARPAASGCMSDNERASGGQACGGCALHQPCPRKRRDWPANGAAGGIGFLVGQRTRWWLQAAQRCGRPAQQIIFAGGAAGGLAASALLWFVSRQGVVISVSLDLRNKSERSLSSSDLQLRWVLLPILFGLPVQMYLDSSGLALYFGLNVHY
jgi:hypothetical protein